MSEQYDHITLDDLRRSERWLKKLAFDLTHNREAAEDLVQDTFVAVLRRPPARPAENVVSAYLGGVLRNVYRMWVRADVRRGRREAKSDVPAEAPSPERRLDANWATGALTAEIDRLSEPYRSTVLARYYEGLSPNEIARRLGVPAATVRKRSQLALGQLRRRLGKHKEGDEADFMRALARAFALPAVPGLGGAGGRFTVGTSMPLVKTAAALGGLALVVGTLVHFTPLRFPAGVAAGSRAAAGDLHRAPVVPRFLPGATRGAADRELPFGTEHPDPLQGDIADSGDTPSGGAPVASTLDGKPCRGLQERVDEASPGATLRIPACIFRESIVITRPVALLAEAGAEIRGSDVWSVFERTGPTTWASVNAIPAFPDPRQDCRKRAQGPCTSAEQVFRDGFELEQVAARSVPGAKQFAVDEARRVILGAPPHGHVVEVTTRLSWMSIGADDVTIRGFHMRHAASRLNGFVIVNPSRHASIIGNRFSDSHRAAVVLAGDEHLFAGNEIARAGEEAVRVEPGRGTVVRGNWIFDNGTRLVVGESPGGWSKAGVVVVIHEGVQILDNDIKANRGLGVALFRGTRAIVRGNRLTDNEGAAVAFHEVAGGEMTANRLSNNGWQARPPEPGVFVTSSHHIVVSDNTLVRHPFGVHMGPSDARSRKDFDACLDTFENRIADNVFIGSGGLTDFIVATGNPLELRPVPTCPSNQIARNRLFDVEAKPAADQRDSRLLSVTERDALLARAGLPPARD